MAFHEYLKRKRIEAALSQKLASEKMGYKGQQLLSAIEKGKTPPSVDHLRMMCKLYGVPESEMLTKHIEFVCERAVTKTVFAWQTDKSG